MEFPQLNLASILGSMDMLRAAKTEEARRKQAEKQAEANKLANMLGIAGAVGGGVLGSGNPAAIGAGYALGKGVGGMIAPTGTSVDTESGIGTGVALAQLGESKIIPGSDGMPATKVGWRERFGLDEQAPKQTAGFGQAPGVQEQPPNSKTEAGVNITEPGATEQNAIKAEDIKDPTLLKDGSKILLPNGRVFTYRKGQ